MDEQGLRRCLEAVIEGSAAGSEGLEALRRSVRQDPASAALCALGLDVADTTEQRVELLLRAAHLCPEHLVTVAGRPEVALMTLTELWRFYLPICQLLLKIACAAPRRILAGITGPPGSGKSVFAALLADLLNECVTGEKGPGAVVCPMDGFHYPNRYLKTHFATDEGGNEIPLLSKKGAPETFDVSAFVRCLGRLQAEPAVTVAAYDRRTHDVMPRGIRVAARHRIALVEGNYLLLNRGGWAEIAQRLDLSIFLKLPLDAARDFIIRRHVRGGRTRADAVRHFEEVDRKNYDVCMSSAAGADIIVRRTAGHRITAVMPGRGK